MFENLTDEEYAVWQQLVTESDFFEMTAAIFGQAEAPDREPDYESRSGSKYWYEDGGVYRLSNHWGYSIASCHWWLDGVTPDEFTTVTFDGDDFREVCGFARFADMVRVCRGDEYWKWFE